MGLALSRPSKRVRKKLKGLCTSDTGQLDKAALRKTLRKHVDSLVPHPRFNIFSCLAALGHLEALQVALLYLKHVLDTPLTAEEHMASFNLRCVFGYQRSSAEIARDVLTHVPLSSSGKRVKSADGRISFSPLLAAALHGQFHIIEWMAEVAKIDIRFAHPVSGYTVLHAACQSNQPELLQSLLTWSLDVPYDGAADAASQASEGEAPTGPLNAGVYEPLQDGTTCAWVDYFANAHVTPLMVACFHGHSECVRVLLRNGASLKGRSSNIGLLPLPSRSNVLHFCARGGHQAVTAMVLQASFRQLGGSMPDANAPAVHARWEGNSRFDLRMQRNGIRAVPATYATILHNNVALVTMLNPQVPLVQTIREHGSPDTEFDLGVPSLYVLALISLRKNLMDSLDKIERAHAKSSLRSSSKHSSCIGSSFTTRAVLAPLALSLRAGSASSSALSTTLAGRPAAIEEAEEIDSSEVVPEAADALSHDGDDDNSARAAEIVTPVQQKDSSNSGEARQQVQKDSLGHMQQNVPAASCSLADQLHRCRMISHSDHGVKPGADSREHAPAPLRRTISGDVQPRSSERSSATDDALASPQQRMLSTTLSAARIATKHSLQAPSEHNLRSISTVLSRSMSLSRRSLEAHPSAAAAAGGVAARGASLGLGSGGWPSLPVPAALSSQRGRRSAARSVSLKALKQQSVATPLDAGTSGSHEENRVVSSGCLFDGACIAAPATMDDAFNVAEIVEPDESRSRRGAQHSRAAGEGGSNRGVAPADSSTRSRTSSRSRRGLRPLSRCSCGEGGINRVVDEHDHRPAKDDPAPPCNAAASKQLIAELSRARVSPTQHVHDIGDVDDEADSQTDAENACPICLDEATQTRIGLCGHALCVPCARQLCTSMSKAAECPMCRGTIDCFQAA